MSSEQMSNKFPLLSSLQNSQVKDLVRLRKRRERDRQGLTIIEEPLVIRRALAAGYPFSVVYFCPEMISAADQTLLAELATGATDRAAWNLVEVTAPVMARISYRDNPQGLLIVAPQQHLQLAELPPSPDHPPLLVVLESVEKPGNLGAILRIADGAGADAVIVCGQGTDLFNPNVLRASRGAFFTVPTAACSQAELLSFLSSSGIRTVATSPAAEGAWSAAALTGPTAILLGTEHDGLSAGLLAKCHQAVSIPMRGQGDSLNVATAAAILLYEAVRQRQGAD